jgi:ABC-type multidrug transport system ATPase subunit
LSCIDLSISASVLIMDEPTAGLDPNQIREVRETILAETM